MPHLLDGSGFGWPAIFPGAHLRHMLTLKLLLLTGVFTSERLLLLRMFTERCLPALHMALLELLELLLVLALNCLGLLEITVLSTLPAAIPRLVGLLLGMLALELLDTGGFLAFEILQFIFMLAFGRFILQLMLPFHILRLNRL